MLSVAAKLVARLVATRMAHWAEQYITEEQNGFLQKRGIDDAHQLARRMVVIAKHDYRIAITNFDIVRAYTRVCMDCTLDFVGSPWSPAILCPNTKSPPRTHAVPGIHSQRLLLSMVHGTRVTGRMPFISCSF
jgi:histone H3/H4